MSNDSEYAIDVTGLTKSFSDQIAVDHVSLKVRRGEVFGFLGPNGSGKTTTIRMLCGLLSPEDGSGTCLGFDIMRESTEIQKRVGYMTQKFSLYEDLTIEENLLFVCRMYQMDNLKERVAAALSSLGLYDRRKQLAGALSGGWKQRLALVACMIHEPELLLLDEPTAGVDPKARRSFWDEIHEMAAKGITVLVSTHYMDEAERCHRLAYLSNGKLLAQGTGPELIKLSGLHTWRIEGENLTDVQMILSKASAVETMAPFGARIRASGTDEKALEKAVIEAASSPDVAVEKVPPGLEDVFIHFSNSAGVPIQ